MIAGRRKSPPPPEFICVGGRGATHQSVECMKCTDGYATDDAYKLEPEQMRTTNNIHPDIQTRLTTAVLLGRSKSLARSATARHVGTTPARRPRPATTQSVSHDRDRWQVWLPGSALLPTVWCCATGRPHERLVTGPCHRHQPKAAPHLQWQTFTSSPRRPVQNHPEGAIRTAGIYARKVGVAA
jgi:hypothetical protein